MASGTLRVVRPTTPPREEALTGVRPALYHSRDEAKGAPGGKHNLGDNGRARLRGRSEEAGASPRSGNRCGRRSRGRPTAYLAIPDGAATCSSARAFAADRSHPPAADVSARSPP